MDRFKLMETYTAVVKLGSYSQAAKALGVTRSMISKRVQDLEDELGTRLLNRNTHRLSMTASGTDYYESCLALLKALHALEERVQAKRAVPSGELKILASKTFSDSVLAPVVAEFCRTYPTVSVDITLRDRDMAPQQIDIVAGGFDLVVRSLPPMADSALVARPIADLSVRLVASPDYLARFGTPQRAADLIQHNCLDPSGAPFSIWEFTGPAGPTRVRVSGSPRVNSSTFIRQLAEKGLGIAMLREYMIADGLADGSLIEVLPDYAIPSRMLLLIYQKDRYQPLRVRLFIDLLSARIQERFSSPAHAAIADAGSQVGLAMTNHGHLRSARSFKSA
jgi:DNA-binding transcriptional LysR family regulator